MRLMKEYHKYPFLCKAQAIPSTVSPNPKFGLGLAECLALPVRALAAAQLWLGRGEACLIAF